MKAAESNATEKPECQAGAGVREVLVEASQAPVSDAIDFARAIGKESDKCAALPYPTQNNYAQLERWSWEFEDCAMICM